MIANCKNYPIILKRQLNRLAPVHTLRPSARTGLSDHYLLGEHLFAWAPHPTP